VGKIQSFQQSFDTIKYASLTVKLFVGAVQTFDGIGGIN
jgi:hypothetical protein